MKHGIPLKYLELPIVCRFFAIHSDGKKVKHFTIGLFINKSLHIYDSFQSNSTITAFNMNWQNCINRMKPCDSI